MSKYEQENFARFGADVVYAGGNLETSLNSKTGNLQLTAVIRKAAVCIIDIENKGAEGSITHLNLSGDSVPLNPGHSQSYAANFLNENVKIKANASDMFTYNGQPVLPLQPTS